MSDIKSKDECESWQVHSTNFSSYVVFTGGRWRFPKTDIKSAGDKIGEDGKDCINGL